MEIEDAAIATGFAERRRALMGWVVDIPRVKKMITEVIHAAGLP